MSKVLSMIGTRPEIVKMSPVIPLLDQSFDHILVHSGQHYSHELDAIFFRDLQVRAPDYMLDVGSSSHGEQTAHMLRGLEPILVNERPDLMLVHGDTNTTLAGGLCAAKLGIPVVHMEAGCRSFNRAMPEEINRVIVDHLAEILMPPDEVAYHNLIAEGLPASRIHIIGSSVIDAVNHHRHSASRSMILRQFGIAPGTYLVLTLHRAENTTPSQLPRMLHALNEAADEYTIVFPAHPRTMTAIHQQGLQISPKIRVCKPLSYLDMLHLVGSACALLTDSGGLQEEAAVLGTPVLVLRNETEWRYLVDAGASVLIGTTYESIRAGLGTWLQPEALARIRASRAPIVYGASKHAVQLMAQYLEARSLVHSA